MLWSPLRPSPGSPPNIPAVLRSHVFSPCYRNRLQYLPPLPSPSWLGVCWQLGRGRAGTLTPGPAGARLGGRCTLSRPPHATKPAPNHKDQATGQPPPQLLGVWDPIQQQTHIPKHCPSVQPSPGEGSSPELVSHALAAELPSYFSLPCEIPCVSCPWQHSPPLLSAASPPEVGLPLSFSCSKASTPAWLWSHQSQK